MFNLKHFKDSFFSWKGVIISVENMDQLKPNLLFSTEIMTRALECFIFDKTFLLGLYLWLNFTTGHYPGTRVLHYAVYSSAEQK